MKKITENWSQTFHKRNKLRFLSSAVSLALLAGVASCDSDSDDDGTDVGTPVEPNTISEFTLGGLEPTTFTGTDIIFEIDFNKEGKSLNIADIKPVVDHNGDEVAGPENFTGGPVEYTVTGEDGEPRTYNVSVKAKSGTEFITTWSQATIEIPTNDDFTFNYNIDIDNDGFIDETGITGQKEVTLDNAENVLRISGQFPVMQLARLNSSGNVAGNGVDNDIITDINQWGTVAWESMAVAFAGCDGLEVLSYTDAPDLSGVTDMQSMFRGSDNVEPNVTDWNTSKVENMESLFRGANNANPDLSNWNISSIPSDSEAMRHIFRESGITAENYGKALVRFAAHASDPNLTLPTDIPLAIQDHIIDFCFEGAVEAKETLEDNDWTRIGDEDCN